MAADLRSARMMVAIQPMPILLWPTSGMPISWAQIYLVRGYNRRNWKMPILGMPLFWMPLCLKQPTIEKHVGQAVLTRSYLGRSMCQSRQIAPNESQLMDLH